MPFALQFIVIARTIGEDMEEYRIVVDKSKVLIDARHVAPRDDREVGSGWIVKS